jgi:hypothetical protein
VWNEVEDGHEWSTFYQAPGKTFQSELLSDVVDLSPFTIDGPSQSQIVKNISRKLLTNLRL